MLQTVKDKKETRISLETYQKLQEIDLGEDYELKTEEVTK